MSGRKPSREQLEKMFPRDEFPNDDAWRATVDVYADSPGSCVGCGHFLDVPFSVDRALSFDGVCRKFHEAVPNRLYFKCLADKGR